jgi:hypothetical protein
LAFSYWIDNLGFITEGKLAAIFIKPSLGVSNWPVILLHQQTQSSLLAPSILRHQQVFCCRCRGKRRLLSMHKDVKEKHSNALKKALFGDVVVLK